MASGVRLNKLMNVFADARSFAQRGPVIDEDPEQIGQ
jgi:hypothetical protein